MDAIYSLLKNSDVKPKPASGVVTLNLPACRGFAANEPRWHRGCSDVLLRQYDGVVFYHNDHLGTPQVITDENQQVVWEAEYSPFGEATITTETITNNIRFPGQYWDEETGLHYNHFRYYDPATGRYLRPDPRGILLDFSDPSRQVAMQLGIPIPNLSHVNSLNQNYAYVSQNPLMYTDSTGEFLGKAINLAFQWCVRSKLGCAAVGGGVAGKNIADRLERQELCEIACTNQCPVGSSDSLFDGSNNFTAFNDTNNTNALTGCKAQCVRDVWGGKPRKSPLPNRL